MSMGFGDDIEPYTIPRTSYAMPAGMRCMHPWSDCRWPIMWGALLRVAERPRGQIFALEVAHGIPYLETSAKPLPAQVPASTCEALVGHVGGEGRQGGAGRQQF